MSLYVNTENYARNLMNTHGLSDWAFGWSNSKRAAGICKFYSKRIELSSHLLVSMSQEEIRETILHEIAHALAGYSNAHNAIWRSKAISIGAKGDRCHRIDDTNSPYIGECDNGHIHNAYRMGKNMRNGFTRCVRDGCDKANIVWSVRPPTISTNANAVDMGNGFTMMMENN